MAAIAAFRRIEVSKLEALRSVAEIKVEKKLFSKKVIDNYWNFLDNNSKRLKDFNGSGYVFADLFIFLEEHKGIHLLKVNTKIFLTRFLRSEGMRYFCFHSNKRRPIGMD